jgi:hypothetical protein
LAHLGNGAIVALSVGGPGLKQQVGLNVNSGSKEVVETHEAAPLSGVIALNHLAAQLAAEGAKFAGEGTKLAGEGAKLAGEGTKLAPDGPKLAPDGPKLAAAKRHLAPSRLGEEELRRLIGELAQGGSNTLAYVVLGPQAALEPAANLPELFWKLVERRVFGAVFSYERGGRTYEDRIVSTPGGFTLERALSD